MISQERLKQLFLYDPDTGHLIYRERARDNFKSHIRWVTHNRYRVGQPAGSINNGGYVKIHIDGVYYSAHRLIWLFIFGDWPSYPEFEIDHVNGVKTDNRIQNLRKCTKSMNQRNGSMRINNKSGVIGVNWVESKQAWIARIWDGPHHRYLGRFTDIEDAREARAKAERELGYHPGHGKPSQAA